MSLILIFDFIKDIYGVFAAELIQPLTDVFLNGFARDPGLPRSKLQCRQFPLFNKPVNMLPGAVKYHTDPVHTEKFVHFSTSRIQSSHDMSSTLAAMRLYLDDVWKLSDIFLDSSLIKTLFFREKTMVFWKRQKGKEKAKGVPSPEAWAIKRGIIFIIIAVAVFFGVRSAFRFLIGWDATKYEHFKEVKLGMKIAFVEELMGNPDRMSDYNLEQMMVVGYKELNARAKQSGATRFSYYDNGVRVLYIFGYDTKGKLVFKEEVSK
jgi:hypothetical protein